MKDTLKRKIDIIRKKLIAKNIISNVIEYSKNSQLWELETEIKMLTEELNFII